MDERNIRPGGGLDHADHRSQGHQAGLRGAGNRRARLCLHPRLDLRSVLLRGTGRALRAAPPRGVRRSARPRESDKPQGPYPITAYADDVAHLIATLGLGKVVAVGHSMGGITVLQLGATHSDKVAAIVMVDPAPLVFPPELKAGFEQIVSAIESGDQEPRRQLIANALFLPTSDKKLVDHVLKVMMAAPPHVASA